MFQINHDAVTAAEFNPHRVYRPPPEPEKYRSPSRARSAAAAVSGGPLAGQHTSRDRANMDVDSGNESGLSSRRGKFRYGVVLEGDTTKWLGKHEIITTTKPMIGEVFIDGPLSDLPPKPREDVPVTVASRRLRSSSQPPQGYPRADVVRGASPSARLESQFSYSVSGTIGTSAQASAAAAFFARLVCVITVAYFSLSIHLSLTKTHNNR